MREVVVQDDPAEDQARRGCEVLRLACCGPGGVGRDELERYVSGVYAGSYGARLTQFLPFLLGVRHASGDLAGVIGARAAVPGHPLFLETYLDAPVQDLMAARLSTPVVRTGLVEVGNLASAAGGGRLLLGTLAHLLAGVGRTWAVFTATRPLRGIFDRLGLQPHDLGAAEARLLGPAAAQWGSYYETEPRVCALRIVQVCKAVRGPAEPAPQVDALWRQAELIGQLARETGP